MEQSVWERLIESRKTGKPEGIVSVCSANEYVLGAAMEYCAGHGKTALIEATANQVNQFGGYTGMRPCDFYRRCKNIAKEAGLPEKRLLLGGNHLGPLTWRQKPENEAMLLAEQMAADYVKAGFEKIHLDASVRLADDDVNARLSDDVIARRSARLCAAAENAYIERLRENPDAKPPVYVIGSEVPVPGGARDLCEEIHITQPDECRATISAFEKAFAEAGLGAAWNRVVAMVVQPGVEFGDDHILEYKREKAAELCAVLSGYPLVFEGHSTDYQTGLRLRQMVEDGIAVLKVGPALTFALREGLFALEHIERVLLRGSGVWLSEFKATLERVMLENDGQWRGYYHGNRVAQAFARRFSRSDRSRYYLDDPRVEACVKRLIANLSVAPLPEPLISQYMPIQYERVRNGLLPNSAEALLKDRVANCLDVYWQAAGRPDEA